VALETFLRENRTDVAVVVERFGGAKRGSRGASSGGKERGGDQDGGTHERRE